MGKPPTPGIFDWRRQVIQTVTFVAFVAALGFVVSRGALDYLSNEVTLTIEPSRTEVDFNTATPPVIQLHIRLKNNTGTAVTLEAQSTCKILQWVILNRAQDLIQARGGRETECADQPLKHTLAPDQQIDETYALMLLPERFDAAGTYEAHVRYWGYKAIIPFTVTPKKP